MKKRSILLVALLLSVLLSACGKKEADSVTEKLAPYAKDGYITSDEVDIRAIAVQYMYDMANIEWTATTLIDYTENGFSRLIYEPGQKYLGMVYNNNQTGLEVFETVLDEEGNYIGESTSFNSSPGNSCATSIEHAWQTVSASVEYHYSMDMMPWYEETSVVAVGDIDWSLYDGKNTTNSILKKTDKNVVYEAYAAALPGDAFMRYQNTGGHALMVTLEPKVVRDSQGNVDPNKSYVYLTDQNCVINTKREYPSSWKVDNEVTFAQAYLDGYLPVSTIELQEGKAPFPTFDVNGAPTAEDLAKGNLKGSVRCNYCLMTIKAEVTSGDEVVRSVTVHPYARNFGFKTIKMDLGIADLPEGDYCLTIEATIGFGTEPLLEVEFTK